MQLVSSYLLSTLVTYVVSYQCTLLGGGPEGGGEEGGRKGLECALSFLISKKWNQN